MSKFLTLLQRLCKKDGRPNPFVNGRPGLKVVVIIQEKKSNCLSSHSRETAVGPSQVLYFPRYYQHGIVSSRYFLRITTFSIKHHKSGMPMKQGFPYVPPQARFSAFVAVKMSILLQLADTKEQINVLCAVSASGTARDRTWCRK